MPLWGAEVAGVWGGLWRPQWRLPLQEHCVHPGRQEGLAHTLYCLPQPLQ